MERDFAQQSHIRSRNLKARGQQDKVRNRKVEWRPNHQDKAESSEGAEMPDNKGKEPELCDHRINALDCHHEADHLS